jgi:plastocyanin
MVRTLVRSFVLVVAAASAIGAAAGPKPIAHQVMIEGVQFVPQTLTLKVGDSVEWINHDPFPHTVSAVGRQFDSHEIAAGRSWKFTATKGGEFAYVCSLHSTMQGTLRVE